MGIKSTKPKPSISFGWLHWSVIIASVSLTVIAWRFSVHQVEQKQTIEFNKKSDQIIDMILERLERYEGALRAGAAYLSTMERDADYKQWKSFANNLQIEKRYPGTNGIGIIYRIEKSKMQGFMAEKNRMREAFQVFPKHDYEFNWPITYIEPENINEAAIGLDIAHENNRRLGAQRAMESGKPTITAPIILVQDQNRTPGFLFYVPFYQEASKTNLLAPAAGKIFRGLVYAPFIVEKLVYGTLGKAQRQLNACNI